MSDTSTLLTVVGTPGDDYLIGTNGGDLLDGGGGYDQLLGLAGDDVLIGGTGDDRLDGGSGDDTYIFAIGDGFDTVREGALSPDAGGVDTVKLLAGYDPATTQLYRYRNDLVIRSPGGDEINVQEHFGSYLDGSTRAAIEQIVFADGTIWNAEAIANRVAALNSNQITEYGDTVVGTSGTDFLNGLGGNDTISGGAGDDTLEGSTGNDWLFGNEHNDAVHGDTGNDVLAGGTGDDFLTGGTGSDTFLFNVGDGVDQIGDWSAYGESNRVVFGAGIRFADLQVSYDQAISELQISIGITGDQVRISGASWDPAGPRTIDSFHFSDGTAATYDSLTGYGVYAQGSEWQDALKGTEFADGLYGLVGDDSLSGLGGNDFLGGGGGNDWLSGGMGDDTYLFNVGDGVDFIDDIAGPFEGNRVLFGAGIALDDLHLRFDGTSTYLEIGASGDAIHFSRFNSPDPLLPPSVELFELADGSRLRYEDLLARGFYLGGSDGADYLIGTPLNDRVYGYGWDDTLVGMEGADTLIGGTGTDYLYGGAGSDVYVFNAGDGNDFVRDGAGMPFEDVGYTDIVMLQSGYDPATTRLERWDNDLVIISAEGGDRIVVQEHFGSYFDGNTRSAIEQIRFADGTIWDSEAINNRIASFNSNALTEAGDTVSGTPWIEYLNGLGGNDTISGGQGDDQIYGGTGNDRLFGGQGSDQLVGEDGNDTLAGGSGADYLSGGMGSDSYVFNWGDGIDLIDEFLPLGEQNRVVFGDGIRFQDLRASYDYAISKAVIDVGNMGDQLRLGNTMPYADEPHAIESFTFADGTVATLRQLYGYGIYAQGTAFDESLSGDSYADNIYARGGDDWVFGNDGNDSIFGGDGNDRLYGHLGNDLLRGEAGNDLLDGGEGDNDLTGGTGDDQLLGSIGSDTYRFDRGDGGDVITDDDWMMLGHDVIRFGAGIAMSDIGISRSADDVVLTVNDPLNGATTDQITIKNWFLSDGFRIEQLTFADGSQMTWEQIQQAAQTIHGTEGADTIYGWPQGTTVLAYGGDDRVYAQDGDDSIYGGDGNDVVDAGLGNNWIDGQSGDDLLKSTGYSSYWYSNSWYTWQSVASFSVLHGGDGNDVLLVSALGNNSLSGGAGDDLLQVLQSSADVGGDAWTSAYHNSSNGFSGGTGNDVIIGSAGHDLYVFDRGDGQDTIRDNPMGVEMSNDITGRWIQDEVLFGAGIAVSDIVCIRVGDDLVMTVNDPTNPLSPDQLTFKNWFVGSRYQIEEFRFSDGSVLTGAQVTGLVNYTPTLVQPLADQTVLEDASVNFVLPADTFVDPDGDALSLSAVLSDGSPLPAWLQFDPATGAFSGLPGNAEVGSLDIRVVAEDSGGESVSDVFTLTVQNVNDAPVAGAPLATLFAAEGQTFSTQLPADAFTDADAVHGDVLTYSATLVDGSPLPTWLNFNPANLVLSGIPTDGDAGLLSVTIHATDSAGAVASSSFYLSIANTIRTGTDQADTLYGSDTNDKLYGLAGNDILKGRSGNDLLVGGTGNDTLYGGTDDPYSTTAGAGNDVYLFNVGDGQDTIVDLDTTAGNVDTIRFGAGIQQSDVSFAGVNGDLIITIGTGGDQISVKNWFSPMSYWYNGYPETANRIERIEFADGTAVDMNTRTDIVHTITGTDYADTINGGIEDTVIDARGGNDQLFGSAGSDTLLGGAGADVLYGGSGDDLLQGGTGNDSLYGEDGNSNGLGNDTYVFNPGDGQDVIYDSDGTAGNTDTVRFGAGITLASLSPGRSGDNLVVTLAGGDSITVYGWYASAANHIETWQFDDGSVLTAAEIQAWADNLAPLVAEPIAAQSANEDASFNFVVPAGTFSDPNPGDVLHYSASLVDGGALPGWLSFDAATGTFSGTPANGDVGSLSVRVTATDNYGVSTAADFVLAVQNTNDAPVLANAIADQVVAEGEAFSYQIATDTFSDVDAGAGDTLTLSATLADGSSLPTWLSFDAASRTFSGNPADGAAGDYAIKVTATDGAEVGVSDEFVVSVADAIATVRTGTSGVDSLQGTAFRDVLNGLGSNDTLYGYAGDDLLDGGSGSDSMRGGIGNDTYVLGGTGDVVVENADEGIDTVQSSISYTLGANVENLTLTGTSNRNATGNSLDNALTGNSGANTLTGNAGNDTLDGGTGTDSLRGGTGNDTYVFARGYGADTVSENDATAGNTDTVAMGVNALDVVFTQSGSNLVMTLHGGTDRLTVSNWYSGSQYQTEFIETADGQQLLNTQVDQFIQAMAQFSATSGLTWDQALDQRPEDVQAVLAAYWQPAA